MISIFLINTIDLIATRQSVREFLSPAEVARADSFRHRSDQDKFIRSRFVLKRVLAGYLGVDVRQVDIEYSEGGKPELAVRIRCDVGFNISHCRTFLAISVGRNCRLGIDVEDLCDAARYAGIEETILSVGQRQCFAALPFSERMRLVLCQFSAKEAILKMFGCGLGGDMAALSLPNDLPNPTTWASVATKYGSSFLRSLPMGSDICGYVCTDLPERDVRIARLGREHLRGVGPIIGMISSDVIGLRTDLISEGRIDESA